VRIDGVKHEFQSIDGVVEDVTDIVLNLKQVLIKSHKRDTVRLSLSADKEGRVTAADIQADSNIVIVNPNQLICTLDRKRRFSAEIEIKVGRGYCPADENKMTSSPSRRRHRLALQPRAVWSSTPLSRLASAR